METTIALVVLRRYHSYQECYDDLISQGCKDLGWVNGGAVVPKELRCEKAYSNRSGSSCIYVDTIRRMFYSVDMGD